MIDGRDAELAALAAVVDRAAADPEKLDPEKLDAVLAAFARNDIEFLPPPERGQ